jgi:hypothetical protein
MKTSTADAGIDYFNRHHTLHRVKAEVALKARRTMYGRVLRLGQPSPSTRILDVGTTPDLAIPYNNFFERWYPHTRQVTACSVEDCANLTGAFAGLRFVPITGDRLPFDDGEFDLGLSFAVLEHVGSTSNQQTFLRELARVTNEFILYTPYRYFPIEMHTFLPFTHWMPMRLCRKLWRSLGLTFWAEERNLNLLSVRDIRRMLPPNGSVRIRLMRTFGWPSNIEVHWRRS